jgi:hypothetical protein
MTTNEYRELMMDILAMSIREFEEQDTDYLREDYTAGIIQGLRIARRKLEVSKFLTQEGNDNE